MRVAEARLEIGARRRAARTSESERRLHAHAEVGGLSELAIASGRVARRRDGREHEHHAAT